MGELSLLVDHCIVVDSASGRILALAAGDELPALLREHGVPSDAVRQLGPRHMLLPGFIDTHVHAPQYEFCGTGTDLPLFDWLTTYTFPTEEAFADVAHASAIYTAVVRKLLRLGTTTAAYFATLHAPACRVLAEAVAREGQRAVVGKVCMDQNSPDGYRETLEAAVAGARDVVEAIEALRCSRLYPCVTPRFIPTCSEALLHSLGHMVAERPGLRVHSHISESRQQVEVTRQLHPSCSDDAEVYARAGLLVPGAVFAHGTQLTPAALARIAASGAGVAHCPLSNLFFGDGLLDVAQAVAAGVRVGLGTDVAGGYSPSMLVAQRMAVVNSHAHKAAALMHRGEATDPAAARAAHELTWRDALWLATAGGARALGLGGVVGAFGVGKEFDALVVDGGGCGGGYDVFASDGPLQVLEKWLNNGDDRQIEEVYVRGVRVV